MTARVLDRNEKDLSKITLVVNELASGRSNANGTFTLTASAASTTVTAANCGAGSHVNWSPLTANASAEVGNGTIYRSAIANGSFTLTHANNGQTDRTFSYSIQG